MVLYALEDIHSCPRQGEAINYKPESLPGITCPIIYCQGKAVNNKLLEHWIERLKIVLNFIVHGHYSRIKDDAFIYSNVTYLLPFFVSRKCNALLYISEIMTRKCFYTL